jgi:hypothetical protein
MRVNNQSERRKLKPAQHPATPDLIRPEPRIPQIILEDWEGILCSTHISTSHESNNENRWYVADVRQ